MSHVEISFFPRLLEACSSYNGGVLALYAAVTCLLVLHPSCRSQRAALPPLLPNLPRSLPQLLSACLKKALNISCHTLAPHAVQSVQQQPAFDRFMESVGVLNADQILLLLESILSVLSACSSPLAQQQASLIKALVDDTTRVKVAILILFPSLLVTRCSTHPWSRKPPRRLLRSGWIFKRARRSGAAFFCANL